MRAAAARLYLTLALGGLARGLRVAPSARPLSVGAMRSLPSMSAEGRIDDRLEEERKAIAELRAKVSELEAIVAKQREVVRAQAAAKAEAEVVEKLKAEADKSDSALQRARAAVEAAAAQIGSPSRSTDGTPAGELVSSASSAASRPGAADGVMAGATTAQLDTSILGPLLAEIEPFFSSNQTNFVAHWEEIQAEVSAALRDGWEEQCDELRQLRESVGASPFELWEQTGKDIESELNELAAKLSESGQRVMAAVAPFQALLELPQSNAVEEPPVDGEPLAFIKGRLLKPSKVAAAIEELEEFERAGLVEYRRFAVALCRRERFLQLASDGETVSAVAVLSCLARLLVFGLSNYAFEIELEPPSPEMDTIIEEREKAMRELSEELSEGDAREAGPWLRRYVLMMQANEDAIMPHNLILLANVLSSENVDTLIAFLCSRTLGRLNLERQRARRNLAPLTAAQLDRRVALGERALRQDDLVNSMIASIGIGCLGSIFSFWLTWTVMGWLLGSIGNALGIGGGGASGLEGFNF